MAGVLYEFVTVLGAEDQTIARTSTLEGGVWFPSEALYAIASREPPSTTHPHIAEHCYTCGGCTHATARDASHVYAHMTTVKRACATKRICNPTHSPNLT